ncbi:flagellar filament capping protein FliD [Brevibacillus reuszeri]|uniref:flagellar filament capping protein FliD n=1 Tax=Brevibacillus reuszeri TaxID=54915 RepID=UPI000CCC692A|nr:flagellar filament capping protein FliD [Brevibacillus reuszeri]
MVSPIRLTGLVSGMDTDNMVKELMKAQRAPLNKLLQKKQSDTWKRDAYREMNALLLDFRLNTVSDMRLQGQYLKKKLVSDNESVGTVRQTGTPNLSAYKVEVTELAKEAEPARFDTTTKVTDSTKELSAVGLSGTFDLSINGEKVTISDKQSMDSVVRSINEKSAKTGVVATFFNSKLIFTSTASGEKATVKLDYTNNDNAKVLGLGDSNRPATDLLTKEVNGTIGEDGTVFINGVKNTITSNKFIYDGIEFNLKSEGVINVNATQDEDAIFGSIKGFIDKYNELIDKINKKISEPRYKDYKPLLDEEKNALDEKQVEKWEEKAKSGVLLRDSNLQSALTEMRQIFSTAVAGIADDKFDTLSDIGITTAKPDSKFSYANYMEKGKLYIDEKKLREAIRENGTKVMDLFTKNPAETTTDKDKAVQETGIAKRLYNSLTGIMSRITDIAGSSSMGDFADSYSMGRQMKTLSKSIDSWELRMKNMEERYYRQFTKMEQAMSKASSQGNWLAQQFGGGQ